MFEYHGRAMGCAVHVMVNESRHGVATHLIETALDRIDELEARWSRFIPSSEISALNRSAGHPVVVSSQTAELVSLSVHAQHTTGGLFNPWILDALRAQGYDRSYGTLTRVGGPPGPHGTTQSRQRPAAPPAPAWYESSGLRRADPASGMVWFYPGSQFDPGGLGKGFAADLVATELVAMGATGALVSLGGDLCARGSGPDDGQWAVSVQHPISGDEIAALRLAEGAVATSSTLRRVWRTHDGECHHLIDPATAQPVDTAHDSPVVATAIAHGGWEAEAWATATIVAGAVTAPDHIEVIWVDRTGDVRHRPARPMRPEQAA